MKLRSLPILATALALAAGAGCRTPQPAAPGAAIRLPDKQVLVLPVLAGTDAGADRAAEDMDAAFARQLAGALGTRAVFATRLPRLQGTLAPGNLWRDGRLALSEIATLAQVAECGSAFVFVLAESSPYPPQRITGAAVLVAADTGAALAERLVVVDLANPGTSDAYCHYLEQTRTFRVGNLESSREDRVHTALLSPRLFRDFVAHAAVGQLFGGQAAGTPLHMPAPPRRPRLRLPN